MTSPISYVVGDSLSLPLADNSVDLVFCSPPYEDARLYGDLNFKMRGQEWVKWCIPRFIECLRVSRGLVAWVVEGKTRKFRWSATPALLMAALHDAGVHLRKPPAFQRVGIPGSGGPDWLRNDYEFVLCATNGGKLPWSDNTACGHEPKYGTGGACTNRNADGRRLNQEKYGDPDGNAEFKRRTATSGQRNGDTITHAKYARPKIANPGNVIACKVGGGHMGHELAHENEAPFPLSLAEFFIKSFCPPDGVVLDPFCGSGTTGHAAVIHKRRAILCDIREDQIALTKRRMADVFGEGA